MDWNYTTTYKTWLSVIDTDDDEHFINMDHIVEVVENKKENTCTINLVTQEWVIVDVPIIDLIKAIKGEKK